MFRFDNYLMQSTNGLGFGTITSVYQHDWDGFGHMLKYSLLRKIWSLFIIEQLYLICLCVIMCHWLSLGRHNARASLSAYVQQRFLLYICVYGGKTSFFHHLLSDASQRDVLSQKVQAEHLPLISSDHEYDHEEAFAASLSPTGPACQ